MNYGKKFQSYFGVELENKVIEQGSNALVVLLQGIGYTYDMPLLYFSKKLAMEKGYDVLPVEYGAVKVGIKLKLDNKKEIGILIEESCELIKMALSDKYKKIIFIGKSIGTVVQRTMEINLKDYNGEIVNVYLTPINKTCELGIQKGSLVVCGTKDPFITCENREKLMCRDDIKYIEIKDANHSLMIECDVETSVKALEEVLCIIKQFI